MPTAKFHLQAELDPVPRYGLKLVKGAPSYSKTPTRDHWHLSSELCQNVEIQKEGCVLQIQSAPCYSKTPTQDHWHLINLKMSKYKVKKLEKVHALCH